MRSDETCTIVGCRLKILRKGFCNKHYTKWHKYGDPLAGKEHHGLCKTPEWYIWVSMKQRCYNSNGRYYKHYGKRGIKVCDRWLDKRMGFLNFLEDMGKKPKGFTLERIDNDGNYGPHNCKWATYAEQSRNQRSNVIHNMGEADKIRRMYNDGLPLVTIAEIYGVGIHVIYQIVNNKTWKSNELLAEAISIPH